MKITGRRILYLGLAVFAIYLFGGGLEFTIAMMYGGNIPMQNPTLSAFAPVQIMFIALGFVGIMLLYHGGTILKTDVELGKKQVEAGFIIIYFMIILIELLARLPAWL